MDLTLSSGFPLGVMNVIHLASKSLITRNKGLVITIDDSFFVKIMFKAFERVYPKAATAYHLVDTFDQAISLLEQERGTSITQSISPFK
jgi:hypothetical protein